MQSLKRMSCRRCWPRCRWTRPKGVSPCRCFEVRQRLTSVPLWLKESWKALKRDEERRSKRVLIWLKEGKRRRALEHGGSRQSSYGQGFWGLEGVVDVFEVQCLRSAFGRPLQWGPDHLTASMEYSQAATHFRAAGLLKESAGCLKELEKRR